MMTTNELRILLEAAEQLGHTDLPIFYDNGRDGHEDLTEVSAKLVRNSEGPNTCYPVYLVFK